MRTPVKTISSLTVQRKLDLLNEALYADTRDLSIHVELVAGTDFLWVFKYCYGALWDTVKIETTVHLYIVLDKLTAEARYDPHTLRWYEEAWFTLQNCYQQ